MLCLHLLCHQSLYYCLRRAERSVPNTPALWSCRWLEPGWNGPAEQQHPPSLGSHDQGAAHNHVLPLLHTTTQITFVYPAVNMGLAATISCTLGKVFVISEPRFLLAVKTWGTETGCCDTYLPSQHLWSRGRRTDSCMVSSHLPGVLLETLLQNNKNRLGKENIKSRWQLFFISERPQLS